MIDKRIESNRIRIETEETGIPPQEQRDREIKE